MRGTVISVWSAISPLGIGADTFTNGIAACGIGQDAPVDDGQPRLVPDFDIATVLGPKGTRAMNRITGLAVATIGQVLAEAGMSLGDATVAREDIGLVLGTANGSIKSVTDFVKDGVFGSKPYHVDPARFPGAIMNVAAGQSAIWHKIRGPNTTLSAGQLSGMVALNYARRLHRTGRARWVLCGGVEEFSDERAMFDQQTYEEGSTHSLGEGCAVFLLESADDARAAGRLPRAELLALETSVALDANWDEALATCMRRALQRAGVSADEVGAVAVAGLGGRRAELEHKAVSEILGDTVPRLTGTVDRFGDTGAASVSLQLAEALVAAVDPARRVAVITSTDRDGQVGCLVVRLP